MLDSAYIFVLMTSLFTVLGQLIIKWRIDSIKFSLSGTLSEKLMTIVSLLFDKFIVIGLISAVCAAILWMIALSKLNLSHAYPVIIALVITLTVLSSVIFLGETLSFFKILGIAIILLGLAILLFGDTHNSIINRN